MKSTWLFFHRSMFCLLVFFGCESSSPEEPEPENQPPGVPELQGPEDQTCTDTKITLKWTAVSDPEGGAIAYDVYFDTQQKLDVPAFTDLSTTRKEFAGLEMGTDYYWRVVAKDDAGNKSSSMTSYFKTIKIAEINHQPEQPYNNQPSGVIPVDPGEVTLAWSCSDKDEDELTYTLYFEDKSPPENEEETGLSDTTYTVTVQSGKSYFWKIGVKDKIGNTNMSPTWKFNVK